MNRVPLIDVREIMKSGSFQIVTDEPTEGKVPPVEWAEKNRFAGGFEPVVQAELQEIIRQIEAK